MNNHLTFCPNYGKSEVVFLQVRELMNSSVVTIDPGESAALAARLLSRHNIGSLPVCSADGHLLGIVTGTSSCGAWPPRRTPSSCR